MNAIRGWEFDVSSLLESQLVERLGWSLLHSVWQFAVIGLLLVIVLRLLARRSAQARYVVCGTALASMVLLSAWTMATLNITPATVDAAEPRSLPDQSHANEFNSAETLDAATPEDVNVVVAQLELIDQTGFEETEVHPLDIAVQDKQPRVVSPTATSEQGKGTPATSPPAPWWRNSRTSLRSFTLAYIEPRLTWIVAVWLAGVLVLSSRPLVGWFCLRRLRHVGVLPVESSVTRLLSALCRRLGIDRAVSIVQSSQVSAPATIGSLRPLILLPASAMTGLSAQQLEAVLAHELAHIRRYDFAVNLLQTFVETVLFYHPAVWWVSKRIRLEREHCCDDIATECVDRATYAGALLAIDELRPAHQNAWAMSSNGGSLVSRIRRLAGQSPSHGNMASVLVPALLTVLAMLAIGVSWVGTSQATDSPAAVSEQKEKWGQVSAGLQCRAVPVLASMPDDDITLDAIQTKFARPADVAFAVELKNVSDAPIKLCEPVHQIRTAQGKIKVVNQFDWFSQYLFSVDFYQDGKKIDRPEFELVHWQLPYFSMDSKTIQPGESRRFILRTSKWQSFVTTRLRGGAYEAVVRYGGLPKRTAEGFIREKIKSSVAGSWSGDVASSKIAFEVKQRKEEYRQKLKWGEVKNGLRAALELVPNKAQYAQGERPLMKLHVENIRSQSVSFVSMTHLPDGSFEAIDQDGNMAKKTGGGFLSGFINSVGIRLKSKQKVTLDSGALLFSHPKIIPEQFETAGHRQLIARPGKYQIRRSHSFGGFSKDNPNPVLRAKDGWGGGSLMSGYLPVTIVAKPKAELGETTSSVDDTTSKPKEDIKATGPKVIGTIVDQDDNPISGASVHAFRGIYQDETFVSDANGQIQIPRAWREKDVFRALVAVDQQDAVKRLGWFSFSMHKFSSEGQKTKDGSFRIMLLPIDRRYRGQVTDEDGKPLSDVDVSVSFTSHDLNFFDSHWDSRKLDGKRILAGTRTDKDGRYEVMLPADSAATLRAAHPDWATQRISILKGKGEFSETRLKPAAKVGGRVIDQDGNPLADVKVAAQIATPGKGMSHGGWGETKTDKDGRYVIGGLTDDQWNVMLMSGTFQGFVAPVHPAVKLVRSQTTVLDFKLQKGQKLTGKVLHHFTGKPVVNCSVQCQSEGIGKDALVSAATNSDGEFELFVLPGKCRVFVSGRPAPGQDSHELVVKAGTDPDPIELMAGDEESLDGMRYFVGQPLDRRVNLTADRMPLHRALSQICDEAGVTLDLDEDALKSHGYTKNIAVTVELKRTPLRIALERILAPYIQLESKLVDGRTIHVTSRKATVGDKRVTKPKTPASKDANSDESKDTKRDAPAKDANNKPTVATPSKYHLDWQPTQHSVWRPASRARVW